MKEVDPFKDGLKIFHEYKIGWRQLFLIRYELKLKGRPKGVFYGLPDKYFERWQSFHKLAEPYEEHGYKTVGELSDYDCPEPLRITFDRRNKIREVLT